MAEELNQKATTCFKGGQYGKAEHLFAKASRLRPDDPKYSSNRSAALYEEGKYGPSIEAISEAWRKIRTKRAEGGDGAREDWDVMSTKLAVQFVKAKLQLASSSGVASTAIHYSSGAVPSSSSASDRLGFEDPDVSEDIELYVTSRTNPESDARIEEMVQIWDQWKTVRNQHASHTATQCQAIILGTQVRRGRSPSLNLRVIPLWSNTMHFGHDDIHSLLDGTEDDDDIYPIHLDQLNDENRKVALSFLFGGSGDAHHVFGNLIDVAHKLCQEIQGGRNVPKVHMTLVDIHPASLARSLVVFLLLHKILVAKDEPERLELQTTLFYLYTSLTVPDYSNEIVMKIAKELSNAPLMSDRLPSWMHLNAKSARAIADVLQYWSAPMNKSTQVLLELHNNLSLGEQADRTMSGVPLTYPSSIIEPYRRIETEKLAYDTLRILLPSSPLLSQLPSLARMVDGSDRVGPLEIMDARQEVFDCWKPNPMIFDKSSTEHRMLCKVPGYPLVTMDPYQTVHAMMVFNRRVKPRVTLPFGRVAFSVISTFFNNVGDAIALLGENLTIEVVREDVISGLSRLVADDLGKRPGDFLQKFSRIWPSNVPDYTNGLLNTAVHILPYQSVCTNDAMVPMTMFNCLLNTHAFRSMQDFCSNRTRKYLGCVFAVTDYDISQPKLVLAPTPLPRPLWQLASKAELYRWLSHLLLCILCNGIPLPPPKRVDLPNNLSAFFRLLVHLHNVGFPAHWLGEFVQMMISGILVTDRKPYLGRLPVPQSAAHDTRRTSRKVYLEAWQAELEVILATAGPALPFYIPLPKEYPSFNDVRTYKATVTAVDLTLHRFFPYWASLSSPFKMTTGLIFYRPNPDFGAELLAHQISFILEGDEDFRAVPTQIMLGPEYVDLTTGEVRWRMSKEWYERMKKENWKMAVYRTDLTVAASEPLTVDNWTEMQD